MADLLTLTCPTCGGSLQVTNDVDHFVCVHCGNTHVVDPGKRVESLAAEVEKLRAESAIRRLQKQIRDWKQLRDQLSAEVGTYQQAVQSEMFLYRGTGLVAFLIAILIVLSAVGELTSQRYGIAILAVGAAVVIVAAGRRAMRHNAIFRRNALHDPIKEISEMDRQIAQLQHELDQERRRLVDSK